MALKDRVIFIIGPTAVGKSGLALKLAKGLKGEIISADSMQVYKGLDIGTAKPTKDELKDVPHHLIDILPPDKDFSVSDFIGLTNEAIEKIIKKKNLPIVVGGTGMYLYALLEGFDMPDIQKDLKLREKLEKEADDKGLDVLYARLMKVDPNACNKIHGNDKKRIIRALEVYELTGKPMTEVSKKGKELPFTPVIIGLNMDRDKLYKRIEARVNKMIDDGLVDEVRGILRSGVDIGSNSMQGIGYKEVVGHLNGEYGRDEMIELIKKNTRNFAKRQMTWFKRFKEVEWFDVEKLTTGDIIKAVEKEVK